MVTRPPFLVEIRNLIHNLNGEFATSGNSATGYSSTGTVYGEVFSR